MVIKGVLLGTAFAGILSVIGADIDISKLPAPSAKKDLTYAKDIKPLFEKSCFKCHGSEKQKGKLRLDSIEAVKRLVREELSTSADITPAMFRDRLGITRKHAIPLLEYLDREGVTVRSGNTRRVKASRSTVS